jgi:4'-phosphopantetheinyl transferase
VAIWRVDVPADAVVPSEVVGLAQRERAVRMRDRLEALCFLASHAVLRSVLAFELGRSQKGLELTADEFGKPRLPGDALRFNMSRSGSSVLVGISAADEIGVDIEAIRELPEQENLAQTHLSGREYESWRGRSAALPEAAFLEFWTRKEACVKAAGIGLAMPFGRIDVASGVQQQPVAVSFRFGLRDWKAQVVSLPMPSGLVAAAAVIKP